MRNSRDSSAITATGPGETEVRRRVLRSHGLLHSVAVNDRKMRRRGAVGNWRKPLRGYTAMDEPPSSPWSGKVRCRAQAAGFRLREQSDAIQTKPHPQAPSLDGVAVARHDGSPPRPALRRAAKAASSRRPPPAPALRDRSPAAEAVRAGAGSGRRALSSRPWAPFSVPSAEKVIPVIPAQAQRRGRAKRRSGATV